MDRLKNIYREEKALSLVIIISLFLSLLLLLIFGLITLISNHQISTLKSVTEKNAALAKIEYDALILKQKNENKIVLPDDVKLKKANGPTTIHFVFVKPAYIQTSSINPLISAFKNPDEEKFKSCAGCTENISANYLKTFYKNEAKRYKTKDFSIDLKFHGPYVISDLNKVGDFANLWGKDIFAMQKLKDTFNDVLVSNAIPLKDSDLVEYLYFDTSFSKDSETDPESYYDHKKFRSFADPENGRAYVNIYALNPLFSAELTEIVAHETLHLFGATDKYNDYDRTQKCSSRGLGEQDKKPLYPQTKGDIMCLYVQTAENSFKRGSLLENNMNINEITADEIGWEK